jgi:ATP-dependent DNA ligase
MDAKRRLASTVADYAPARLQAVRELPAGRGWVYEPKFDGYRGLLVKGASGKGSVWSRNDKDLGRWFPELVSLATRLPRAIVLDGEIVMPVAGGVSFIALQRRLVAGTRESAAAFIAFDVLRDGDDLRHVNLSLRRKRLQQIVDAQADAALQLMTQTDDRETAELWLDDSVSVAGIEGVVCKLDEPYPKAESRRWRKVRRTSTIDLLVRGIVPEPGDAMRLVLATTDGTRELVGTTYPISGDDARPLQRFLSRAKPAPHRVWAPFEDGRREWLELPDGGGPVAEVMVTTFDSGMLRQPARFVRWRQRVPRSVLSI